MGTLGHNAYIGRVRFIALMSGSDALATWFDETRDLAADFRRAFCSESATLPPLQALIAAGDGDNTGGSSRAALADLRAAP